MKPIYKFYIVSAWLLMFFSLPGQAQSDSLSHYLEVAGRNNRNVKSDFLLYQASLQKIPQAGAYEDPKLDIGFFLKPMQLVDGKQVAQFTLMQMFPWFGTRKAARTEAQQMAQMAFEKFRDTRDNLFLEVYSQWFDLCSLKQQILNAKDNRKLLDQLHTLAVRKFSSPTISSGYSFSVPASKKDASSPSSSGSGMAGMSSSGGSLSSSNSSSSSGMTSMGGGAAAMNSTSTGMSEVLRIELEQAELENQIVNLESELKAASARFNALLNRHGMSELYVPDSFEKIPFILNLNNASLQMGSRNPMLTMIDSEIKSYDARADMQKKMSYPMFGIGLQYMMINKGGIATSSSSSMSTDESSMSNMGGMNMVMPMVSVTIPLYRNKYKAQQRETQLLKQAGIAKREATQQMLEAQLLSQKEQLENADRNISLQEKQEKLAETAYQLAVKEFISGKNELNNVLQIQRQLLDYRLNKWNAIAGYNKQVAQIKKLMSFELTDASYENQ
ncbi:MAG: TolC family protein [Dysgonamonadaceae bacterium]